jgi:A/G-specific adenine glycosylase
LPGVGAYTAAAIAAIAFDAHASPVDGNIERVIARLYAVELPLPAAKPSIHRLAAVLTPQRRAGDFAQAMMDLGATICTPKRPVCALCPWTEACAARESGNPEIFPIKTPKAQGRLRRGAAFVAVRSDGLVLVRTRPVDGLLGGMTEVPTTEWTHDFDDGNALADAPRLSGRGSLAWSRLPGKVTHVFTHFPLELAVWHASVPRGTRAPDGTRWIRMADLGDEALPTVMRKVLAHASSRA